jgi:hypothetical protein
MLSDPTPAQILLSHGAEDPEAIFHAIGLRALGNGTATMEALIEHGVDINYASTRWATPLCQAIYLKDEEKLRLLLKHGADPRVKAPGVCRLDAYEYAVELNRERFYEIMEETCRSSAP